MNANVITKSSLRSNPLPVDTNVRVPDAVRRAAEAATRAQAEANPQPPAPAPVPAETITIAEPPAPQLPPGVTSLVPEVPPAPVPPPADNDESWRTKYDSLLGRVKPLQKLVNDQNTRITGLENMLATVQTAPTPVPVPAPVPSKLLTDKEIEDFGPEMIDVVRRAAREIYEPEVVTLRSQVANLEAKLGQTSTSVAMTARDGMLAKLEQDLPEWHGINVAPEFHAWLALPDPFSGVMRKKLLVDAFEQNRTSQVLAFFQGFISELAATTPAVVNPSPLEPPATPPAPVRPTLEQLAAPGRARTAATPPGAPAEKQIIHTSDINAFYAAKRKGLYAGREEEFRQHELELEKAMREGRVVTNT